MDVPASEDEWEESGFKDDQDHTAALDPTRSEDKWDRGASWVEPGPKDKQRRGKV